MPYPFRGNINGSVDSQQQNLPMVVENYAIINKTAATIYFNVYMINGGQSVNMSPFNKSIDAGSIYESERKFLMRQNEIIRLATSGSADYDFFINNIEPDSPTNEL